MHRSSGTFIWPCWRLHQVLGAVAASTIARLLSTGDSRHRIATAQAAPRHAAPIRSHTASAPANGSPASGLTPSAAKGGYTDCARWMGSPGDGLNSAIAFA